MIPCPSFRRGRNGQCVDRLPLTSRDRGLMVGVEVEVAVEIDECGSLELVALVHAGPALTPLSNRPTSTSPRR